MWSISLWPEKRAVIDRPYNLQSRISIVVNSGYLCAPRGFSPTERGLKPRIHARLDACDYVLFTVALIGERSRVGKRNPSAGFAVIGI
jgi:hypothetical protein